MLIKQNRCVVFMKGSPDAPDCGFSSRMIECLDKCEFEDFTFVDVLKSEEVREAVKEVADWPTVPQLWVTGNLSGAATSWRK